MGIPGVPLDKDKILKAIAKRQGIITRIAKELDCDPSTIYKHMETDPQIAQAIKDARNEYDRRKIDQDREIVVKARENVIKFLDEENLTATIFALKSKDGWDDKKGETSSQLELLEAVKLLLDKGIVQE